MFPDFELVHRRDPGRRLALGNRRFWTKDYLERKLEQLRTAQVGRLILCIEKTKSCDSEQAPAHAHILRYAGESIPPRY